MNEILTYTASKPKEVINSTPFFKPVTIQKRSSVGSAKDAYEVEADNMANKVMSKHVSSAQNYSQAGALLPKKCAAYKQEEKVQTRPLVNNITSFVQKSSNESAVVVSNHVENQINSSRGAGNSLDNGTKNFMESHFGIDFSDVKIHTGSQAVQTSRELNAEAFTVGNDIYFNEGKYSPNSDSGKHLLAHELTHTVQQTAPFAQRQIQRAPEEKVVKRKDIIIVGEGWTGSMELAKALKGAKIIQVNSSDALLTALQGITDPVGTLFFVTHATSTGKLKFGDAEGFVNPSDIAKKLSGTFSASNAPEKLDFRGCSIGTEPAAMNELGLSLGAKSVLAGNCYAVIARTTPIEIGGKKITKSSQVTDANRALFNDLKTRTYNKLGDKKACVLNLSNKDYLAAGGVFVQLWFNPTFTGDWLPGKSVCYSQAGRRTATATDVIGAAAGCQAIEVQPVAVTTSPLTVPDTAPVLPATEETIENE